jgi:hypothetical protein
VLVDGWQPHAYVHNPSRPRTLILALYVEPQWLKDFRPGWGASGSPGFWTAFGRSIPTYPSTFDGSRHGDDGAPG